MNIVFAANGYVERGIPKDGFPMYLYRVSHALKALGHTPVIVYCSDRDSSRVEDGIRMIGIKYQMIRSKIPWLNAFWASVCRSYRLNKKLKELIRTEHADIIQFTSLNAVSLLYTGKVPAVMRLSSYTKKQNPIVDALDRHTIVVASMLELAAGRICSAVFAPSNVTAKAFEKDFGRRVYVFETPYVNQVVTYDDSFYEKNLKGKKYVLFFGRLYYVKGITVIAEIIEKFLEKYQDYYFAFVGEALPIQGRSSVDIIMDGAGKYRDRVIISKALEHNRLYPVIENADFIVMPSIIDNFPNACIEAMALSRLVIGTDGASFEQLITDRKSGLLCKIGDAGDLLEKMETAADMDNQEKQKIGEQAKLRIMKLHPDIVVKKLVRFYEAVVGLKPSE